MKTHHLLAIAALSGAVVLPFLLPRAAAGDALPLAEAQEAEEAEAVEKADPLHESMETLQRSMRAMRKLMSKPESKAEALAACQSMEASIRVALEHPPKRGEAGILEGSALLAHQIAFKQQMLATYGVLLELETALDAGDGDAAKAAYRALGKQKKDGHDAFMFDEH